MFTIMIENKKVITRSLIVLFLCLSIVYSLTYQKKESLFKASIKSWNETISQTGNQNLWLNLQNSTDFDENAYDAGSFETSDSVSLWSTVYNLENGLHVQNSVNELSDSVSLSMSNNKILPNTTEYFGTLDIVNILDKKPEFTLQDSKWNYFAYYGNNLDFVETIEALGGNVYEMVTESEILQNQLFGDRVSYINLSMFKDIRVLMVVEIDGDVWLLQIPADKYHYSKDYLKSLFIH